MSQQSTISFAELKELLELLTRYNVCVYSNSGLHIELKNNSKSEFVVSGKEEKPKPKEDPELTKFLANIDPKYHQFFR